MSWGCQLPGSSALVRLHVHNLRVAQHHKHIWTRFGIVKMYAMQHDTLAKRAVLVGAPSLASDSLVHDFHALLSLQKLILLHATLLHIDKEE
jgi:hypothetical protein